jgi:hypothetical protein
VCDVDAPYARVSARDDLKMDAKHVVGDSSRATDAVVTKSPSNVTRKTQPRKEAENIFTQDDLSSTSESASLRADDDASGGAKAKIKAAKAAHADKSDNSERDAATGYGNAPAEKNDGYGNAPAEKTDYDLAPEPALEYDLAQRNDLRVVKGDNAARPPEPSQSEDEGSGDDTPQAQVIATSSSSGSGSRSNSASRSRSRSGSPAASRSGSRSGSGSRSSSTSINLVSACVGVILLSTCITQRALRCLQSSSS